MKQARQAVSENGVYQIIITGMLSDNDKLAIMDFCHRTKRYFINGYPHGKETRRRLGSAGIIFQKWQNHPAVTIAYSPKPTQEGGLIISIYPANNDDRPKDELEFLGKLWQDIVTKEINAFFNKKLSQSEEDDLFKFITKSTKNLYTATGAK